MTRRQFAHLAGAHQVNVLPFSDAEYLLAPVDRDRSDRNADEPIAVSVRTLLATAKARVSSVELGVNAPTARAVA